MCEITPVIHITKSTIGGIAPGKLMAGTLRSWRFGSVASERLGYFFR